MTYTEQLYTTKPLEILGDKSMVIAMEELAELQQAISKGIRGKLDYDNLVEEVSDVMIVLEWIKNMHNVQQKDIDLWLDYKRERIIDRVNMGTLK